jgi:hypothetical protein
MGQIFPSPTKKKGLSGPGSKQDPGEAVERVTPLPKLPPYLVGAQTRIVERYDQKTVADYFRMVDINTDRWLSFREMWMAWGTRRGEFLVIDSDNDGGVLMSELDSRFRMIVDSGGAFPVPYLRGPGPLTVAAQPESTPAASMPETVQPEPPPEPPKEPAKERVSKASSAMEAGFRRFDTDGNSLLSVTEVSTLLVVSGLVPESGVPATLEGLDAHDKDKDGMWSLDEFLSFLDI